MNTEVVEIECPNCGKNIHSNESNCPYCCTYLDFHDIDDLEDIANGREVPEPSCTPKIDEPNIVEPKADEPRGSEKKCVLGRFFGRKKK